MAERIPEDERTVYDAVLPVFQEYQGDLVRSVETGEPFPAEDFQTDLIRSLQLALQELSAEALTDDISWLRSHFSSLLGDEKLVDIEDALTETLGVYSVVRALYIVPLMVESTLEEIDEARERHIRDNAEKSWRDVWSGVGRAASTAKGETTALLSFAKKAIVSVFARLSGQKGDDPAIEAIWETEKDSRVRPKHRELQGAPMEEWVLVYPYGPSPGSEASGHSGWGCRCRLRLEETTAEQMTEALGFSGWKPYEPGSNPGRFVASLAGMEDL
jgi:hypothetical protein